jgi:hypothetical protein
VLGVTLAMNFGYAAASLVAALSYGGALAHAVTGRWAPAEDDGGDEPAPEAPAEVEGEPVPA